MSCVTILRGEQQHLVSTSGTDAIAWLTPWRPAIGADDATGTLKIANASGGFRAQPIVQTALVRADKPDAPSSPIGTQQTTSGEFYYSTANFGLAALTAGKSLVRFGVVYDISSAPGLGQADVTLEVAVRQCGDLLPAWMGHLVATSADDSFVPVTGWMPALGVVKFEGTIVVSGLTGAFRILLTYRTAIASPEAPDAWDPTGLGSAITSDSETNTGELTPTTTGKMWIQVGIRYDLTSGTFGQADVSAMIGTRSS